MKSTIGKIAIFVSLIVITLALLYHFGFFSKSDEQNGGNDSIDNEQRETTNGSGKVDTQEPSSNKVSDINSETTELRISLDEWHGWKGVVDANKGVNNGRDDSIYKSLGLDVNILVINDDEDSLQAFLNGDVVAIGQSVNEFPYVYARAKAVGVGCKMVLLTDQSIGGDAIVTTSDNITSIEGLLGQRIAVAELSASHIMLEWLLQTSSLTSKDIDSIRSNMILTSSPEETYEALKSGKANVAVLWTPFITKAKNELNAKIVFSTKSASNLAIDGIVFRTDYLESHPEAVEKFIEGALRANKEYASDLTYIKEFSSYDGLSDREILDMASGVSFIQFADNRDLFLGTVQTLYQEMTNIISNLGEDVGIASASAFDMSYLARLANKFADDTVTKITYSEQERKKASDSIDTSKLLKKTLTINFEPNLANILPESYAVLDEFINIAKILNTSLIQIEGNIADIGIGDSEGGRKLSEMRAEAVYDYFVEMGIDPSRMMTKGWGITNPVPELDPRSQEGMAANRRTDIFFLKLE